MLHSNNNLTNHINARKNQMSIEKIDRSFYFHPLINQTHHDALLSKIAPLLKENESLVFYRPSSNQANQKGLNQGGVEGAISQVMISQNNIEKWLIPFYCSKDHTYFSLFCLGEPFKEIATLNTYWETHFITKKKFEKVYCLINLVEKDKDAALLTSTEAKTLETSIKQHVNMHLLLDKPEVQEEIFPSKCHKKYRENIVFGKIL